MKEGTHTGLLHETKDINGFNIFDTRNEDLLRGETALNRSAPQVPSLSLVTERNGCEKKFLVTDPLFAGNSTVFFLQPLRFAR